MFSEAGIVSQINQQSATTTIQEATAVAEMFRDLELLEEKNAGRIDQRSDTNAAKIRTRTGT
jgi:hypothetical protein